MRKRAKRRGGYTLIEVMMAMGVLAAGAVAIMAMIAASTRGNMEAREMTTGNQIAQRWIERLRRDSLHWTRGSAGADPTQLAATTWLGEVADPGDDPVWFTPVALGSETAAFDYYGRDTATAGSMHYCVNARLEWVYPGQAIRADVRVWWRRSAGNGADPAAIIDLIGCGAGIDPEDITDYDHDPPLIRTVYTSTVLRYHTPPAS